MKVSAGASLTQCLPPSSHHILFPLHPFPSGALPAVPRRSRALGQSLPAGWQQHLPNRSKSHCKNYKSKPQPRELCYEKYPTFNNTLMLDTPRVSYSSSGDMTSNPLRYQMLWGSTQVPSPQNYSVFPNSRGFSLPGPTAEKFPYYLQQNITCKMLWVYSLLTSCCVKYEIFLLWEAQRPRHCLTGTKGISWEGGISLEVPVLCPGGGNVSKPLSQAGSWNDSIRPPVPWHSCPCGGLDINHPSSLKSEVSFLQSMWGLYDSRNASLIRAFTY